jgi:hypothetical protein
MSEDEAKEKANEIMSIQLGRAAEPTSGGKFQNIGGRSSWTFHYSGFMVKVNATDGSVCVFENR